MYLPRFWLAVVSALASSAHATQQALWGVGGDHFAHSIAYAGDLDEDGLCDLWTCDPSDHVEPTGSVWGLSGKDGRVLRGFTSEVTNEQFAASVLGTCDHDADGVPDVLVGAPQAQVNGRVCGRVYLCSGRTGTILRHLEAPARRELFGFTLSLLGDLTGDGVPDFVVGARRDSSTRWHIDRHSLFSGADLLPFVLGHDTELHGESPTPAGDVDGDGHEDLLLRRTGRENGVRVVVLSGCDGSVIHELKAGEDESSFGDSLAGLGDLDGDGQGDFAVGVPALGDPPEHRGYVRVYSGRDAAPLYRCWANLPEQETRFGERPRPVRRLDEFGSAIAAVGDLDGDGVCDLMIGAPAYAEAQIHSGCDGALRTEYRGRMNFGELLLGGRDLDGDGVPDPVVGDFFYSIPCRQGQVHVLSGETEEWLFKRGRPSTP